ncbi:MAG: DsbC family protein [Arhodomonas sp.]|nr:DsbC family protein [Arhodomonas sp.]
MVYVTGDGNYLLQGELVDIDEQRSLTEEVRAGIRQERLADLDESGMLIYEPSGEVRHEVTVFTDIDCPYCRRFHAHMDELLERGIRVRYLLMPRAGRDSASYDKAVNAWCAEDPQSALTRAKQGERLAEQDCDHPVDEHLRLARELGVRGTPTLYTGEGRMLSGYRTPDELESALDGG